MLILLATAFVSCGEDKDEGKVKDELALPSEDIPVAAQIESALDSAFNAGLKECTITVPIDTEGYNWVLNVNKDDKYADMRVNLILESERRVASIKDDAFRATTDDDMCSILKSIVIPKGVTYIGKYAFYGCENLTSITIPEGVTYIGKYAFYGCESLTSITIPESVTDIAHEAFPSLKSVKIEYSIGVVGFIGPIILDCPAIIYVRKEFVDSYKDYVYQFYSHDDVKIIGF